NTAQNMIRKAPGVGDIPILGTLFRSTNFRKGETELVIVVTPYLVRPVDANAIRLPTDGYQTPNEIQRLLGNFESDGRSGMVRPVPREMVAAALPPGPGGAPPASAETAAALPPAAGAAPEPRRK
ncbi:MAG: secretion system protein, partial [Novosphingobium sp.]